MISYSKKKKKQGLLHKKHYRWHKSFVCPNLEAFFWLFLWVLEEERMTIPSLAASGSGLLLGVAQSAKRRRKGLPFGESPSRRMAFYRALPHPADAKKASLCRETFFVAILLTQLGERSGSNRLTHAARGLVGNVELALCSQFGLKCHCSISVHSSFK